MLLYSMNDCDLRGSNSLLYLLYTLQVASPLQVKYADGELERLGNCLFLMTFAATHHCYPLS